MTGSSVSFSTYGKERMEMALGKEEYEGEVAVKLRIRSWRLQMD
jgi:hypothetical protein